VGHLIKADEQHLLNTTLTDEQVKDLLKSDLKWCSEAVESSVRVPLTQKQFDALYSLCFNIGEGAFKKSTVVRRLNDKDYIVPGVAKAGDVMRGEESQSLATGMVNGLVVLPGTHSKWVKIENGEIADFRTYLTGELFELLRNHSTLSKATESSAKLAASKEFYAGLDAQVSDLTHDLFTIRANWLQGKSQEASREYLSGLLIGAEIKSAKSWITAHEVTLIASDSLADTYSKALNHFGITSNVQSQMTLISYFAAIAKKVEAQI
jgi:2-dehydro-3-deoxygalactonokinase